MPDDHADRIYRELSAIRREASEGFASIHARLDEAAKHRSDLHSKTAVNTVAIEQVREVARDTILRLNVHGKRLDKIDNQHAEERGTRRAVYAIGGMLGAVGGLIANVILRLIKG